MSLLGVKTLYLRTAIGTRLFSHTSILNVKEVVSRVEGETTIIEGAILPSKQGEVLKLDNTQNLCPVCPYKLGVELKYTDVLVLSQFMRADGCLLPRRITGTCAKGQSSLAKMIHKAQRAGLMPEHRPDFGSGKERTSVKSNYKWKKYNAYYED